MPFKCDLLNGARYEKAFCNSLIFSRCMRSTNMRPCKEIYDTLYKLMNNRGQGDIALGFTAAISKYRASALRVRNSTGSAGDLQGQVRFFI